MRFHVLRQPHSIFSLAMYVAYTDVAMDGLFNEIQQFMVDGNYEAAANKGIENTIY